MREPFYLVWNPKTGYTKHRHVLKKQAEDEAKRLALVNRGEEFLVLMPISSTRVADVIVEHFNHYDDGIPF